MNKLLLAFYFTIFIFQGLAKEIPYLSGPVIDEVNLLTKSEKIKLEDYIRSKIAIAQMQVWITNLENDAIEDLSYRAAKQWGLGTEKKDNGILFLIAPNDRRMRLEIGRGLEGDIPDILAARILDYVARPNFKNGNYYKGIQATLEETVTLLGKGPEAAEAKSKLEGESKHSPDYFFWIIFLIFVINIFIPRRRRHGIFGTTSGWSSGGSGWSGGGSSWSGGGGSFGGGGSSSSW